VSPLSATFSGESKNTDNKDLQEKFDFNIKKNVNAAEISNLITVFPKFSNTRLNSEVTLLKYGLQNYLFAIDSNSSDGKRKSLKKVEKSYKDIQNLRKFLNQEDNELINRYLVRIKTNIAVIEDSLNNRKKTD
jgi:hypothetical protein